MTLAAAMFLNGIDPLGVPLLTATDPLVREAWAAIGVRAGQIMSDRD